MYKLQQYILLICIIIIQVNSETRTSKPESQSQLQSQFKNTSFQKNIHSHDGEETSGEKNSDHPEDNVFGNYKICKRYSDLVHLYRYKNSEKKTHIYTTNYALLGDGKYGYIRERTEVYIWSTQRKDQVELYEFHNPKTRQHFYSTDKNCEHHGYELIGVTGYIYKQPKSETVAIGHFTNHHTKDNIYTPNLKIVNQNQRGFEFTGILGYGCSALID